MTSLVHPPAAITKHTGLPRGYACVGLDLPKNSINVGAALRAAGCYGARMVAISGRRYQRASTDTMASVKHMPLLQVDDLRDIVPYDCIPIAIDLVAGAKPLHRYPHPERAFYVFGPEDGTLGARVLSWCRDVLYVPTHGCMNLAACVNVVLYDRAVKRNEWGASS